ncbi:MAG: carbohydrate ABC transporter permease [Oscillospiraceae bacterium]|jgi:putative aldouronate transport system permease protein|nr:carbohydrate ABC transporter permease [Oscillospiraceae bacterium]
MNFRKTFLRHGISGLIGDVVIYLILLFVLVVTLYPFLNMTAVSFNDALDSVLGGIRLWPRVFTTYNYENIFQNPHIIQATYISVARTVVGSISGLVACMMLAYTLSRREFVLRFVFLKIIVFSMYVYSGLIPFFLLMRFMGFLNSFWVYIIPGMVGAFNVIIIRSYIESAIPDSMIESARIDGASEFLILFRIVAPLSLPVIATVLLWNSVGQWNSWFDAMLFNNTSQHLSTLQYELQKVLQQTIQVQSISDSSRLAAEMSGRGQTTTPQATRAAMTMVATVPILLVYPFVQKYFIHGLTIGGVKE